VFTVLGLLHTPYGAVLFFQSEEFLFNLSEEDTASSLLSVVDEGNMLTYSFLVPMSAFIGKKQSSDIQTDLMFTFLFTIQQFVNTTLILTYDSL